MQVLSKNHRVLFSLDKFSPAAFRASLDRFAKQVESSVGILRCGGEEKGLLLFTFQGEPYAAAAYQAGELRALPLEEFQKHAEPCGAGASFYATNPVFFKLMLVLVQCQPSVVGNGQVINLETLLETIERGGKEEVLLLKKGTELNLFYFREGKLVEGYFADPARHPTESNGLSEAMLLYAFEPGGGLEIRLYDDVQVDQGVDSSPAARPGSLPVVSSPCLEIQKKGGLPIEKRIDKEVCAIGRGDSNDCVIDDTSVSREHARISRVPDGYFIEDLKSRNGTYLDGRRIVKEKLSDGSLLRIGAVEVRFRDQPSSSPLQEPREQTRVVADPPPSAVPVQEDWILEVLEGSQKGASFSLLPGKRISVGRGTVDILLNDAKVSRHHADIEWVEGRYVYQDLQSKNGSFINDQRVSQRRLERGDLVRLGETVLRVTRKP